MEPTVVTPKDKNHWLAMRKPNLNSTEISALFDCNPYISRFELWHQKKTQEGVPFEETERMLWGGLLEPIIAKRAAEELHRLEFPMKDYWCFPELRIGASFDFYTLSLTGEPKTERLMEIKNVDSFIYAKNWIEFDDDVEAPPHIEIQVQAQMLVSGHDACDLCVMVGGNQLKKFVREKNPAMQERILEACAEFWASIDANNPPQVDYSRDSSFLIDLYGTATDDKVLSVEDSEHAEKIKELVAEYKASAETEKQGQAGKEMAKAQILELIGDASKVTAAEFTISCGNVEPTEVKAFVKKGFRNFRVTLKTKKADSPA